MKAIDVGKTVAIYAGRKLVEKAAKRLTTPKPQVANVISIQSQDVFTHSCQSYLIFEGCLTKADGTLYVNADEVALTNNAIMNLFSRIEYH